MTEHIYETSTATTHGIRIDVRCRYAPERSLPAARRYAFEYTVRIRNEGQVAVQLLNRHWVVTDATGKVQDVRGPGVVGEHPILHRGEMFEYTSGVALETASGAMHGSFELFSVTGRRVEAAIAPFRLAVPYTLN